MMIDDENDDQSKKQVKVQREEVNYLQSKLDQLSLQSAPSTPQTDSISSIPHCSCCRFQPNSLNLNKPILHPDPSSSLQSPHTPILSTSNPTTTPTQHHLDNHEWSHQSRPFNPSLLTTSHHQHDPSNPHLPHDHPHPRPSPRSDYNRILHRPPPSQFFFPLSLIIPTLLNHAFALSDDLPPPSSSSYAPRSIACDMAMFEPFTPSNPINSNFYPSVEVGNPSQPANDTQSSVSPTTNAPLDMSNHANGSLQSIISSSSASRDRSPSLSRPHHLASMPPTSAFASASGPHLALHHSVPFSSPRLWSTTSQSAPHTQQSFSSESASLDPHSKPAGLFSVDESHPSSFRLNPPPRPSSEFLPSLSSPHPSHHSPYALLSQPLTGSIEEENRRRREGRAQMGSAYPPQDTSIQNPSSNSGNTFKLNGLPAKVARCEQAVMEASKVVEQAKEELSIFSSSSFIHPRVSFSCIVVWTPSRMRRLWVCLSLVIGSS